MPPKPTCDCGKCLKCCYRTVKRASRLKQKTELKRKTPLTSHTPVKVKRGKPRRVAVVKGEFYPCKPDIFDATYEAVE